MRPVTQCHMEPEPSSVSKPRMTHVMVTLFGKLHSREIHIQQMGLMRLHTVNKRYIYLLIYVSHWSEDSLEPALYTKKASGSSCEKLFDVRVTLCVIWRGEITPHLRGFKEFCFWGSISFKCSKNIKSFAHFHVVCKWKYTLLIGTIPPLSGFISQDMVVFPCAADPEGFSVMSGCEWSPYWCDRLWLFSVRQAELALNSAGEVFEVALARMVR